MIIFFFWLFPFGNILVPIYSLYVLYVFKPSQSVSCFFLTLSILISPNENPSNIVSATISKSKRWSHSGLINLSLHSHCYSSVTDNSRCPSPPTSPCFHHFLHYFSTLLIALHYLFEVFKLMHRLHLYSLHPCCVLFIY